MTIDKMLYEKNNSRSFLFPALVGVVVVLSLLFMIVPLQKPVRTINFKSDSKSTSKIVETPSLVGFIGDSICGGADDGLKEYQRWPQMVSQKLNWFSINACVGGSGYINPGQDGKHTYKQAFEDLSLKILKPNFIVVQGGQNDLGSSVKSISTAACELYAKIRKKYPSAKLIVMTPFYGVSEAPPVVGEVEEVIKECASKYQAHLLTGVRKWMQDHPELLIADGTHPNGKGHALIAKNFVAWFKSNLS